MNKNFTLLSIFLILFSLNVCFANDFLPWQNIRNSSYTIENNIHIRMESTLLNNKLHYFENNEWVETDFSEISPLTHEAIYPYDSENSMKLRITADTLGLFYGMSANIETNEFPISSDLMSDIGEDETGDCQIEDSDFLDLHEQKFAFSDDKFYCLLNTVGTDFPTNDSFTGPYYAYAAGIVNPETALEDSTIYALLYTYDFEPFISPGLYKVNGQDFSSMEKIAEIDYEVYSSNLLMSCNIEDLTNDPDFGDWPNTTKSLGIMPITLKLNPPSDFTIADEGAPASVIVHQFELEPFENSLPEISEIHLEEIDSGLLLSVNYYDENHNFPLLRNVTLNTGDIFELIPTQMDFSEPVQFTTVLPNNDWTNGTVEFSDDNFSFVNMDFDYTPADKIENTENLTLSCYPNPINSQENDFINIIVKSNSRESLQLSIFNIKGQKIYQESLSNNERSKQLSLDRISDQIGSGIYFVSVHGKNMKKTEKIIILK